MDRRPVRSCSVGAVAEQYLSGQWPQLQRLSRAKRQHDSPLSPLPPPRLLEFPIDSRCTDNATQTPDSPLFCDSPGISEGASGSTTLRNTTAADGYRPSPPVLNKSDSSPEKAVGAHSRSSLEAINKEIERLTFLAPAPIPCVPIAPQRPTSSIAFEISSHHYRRAVMPYTCITPDGRRPPLPSSRSDMTFESESPLRLPTVAPHAQGTSIRSLRAPVPLVAPTPNAPLGLSLLPDTRAPRLFHAIVTSDEKDELASTSTTTSCLGPSIGATTAQAGTSISSSSSSSAGASANVRRSSRSAFEQVAAPSAAASPRGANAALALDVL